MEKIKNLISKIPIIDCFVIAIIIIVFAFLSANHMFLFVADKGREFLFPEEILNGNVPYKDIMLIYFPTAYYINAIIYKILGISMNSLIITQTLLSIVYMSFYYLCARLFLLRRTSFLLSLLVISCCIFSFNDLFAFITPYSYARAYGVFVFFLCTYMLVNLFKTDNKAYLYWAAVLSGLCFICKFEFFIVYILLAIALFLYKKLTVLQYAKIFVLSLVFPFILITVLYIQGVSPENIFDAAAFGYKFSKTSAMSEFLSKGGMYPAAIIHTVKSTVKQVPYLITIILLCITALKLNLKYSKAWIIPCVTIFILRFFFNEQAILQYWSYLPVLIFIIFCFKYKELLKDNRDIFVLAAAALLVAQRNFFYLSLYSGVYAFPLLILCFFVFIRNWLQTSSVAGVKSSHIVNYVLFILICLYSMLLLVKYRDTQLPIVTDKGVIYTDIYDYDIFNRTVTYVENKIDKNATVLVLPEGHIINFLTDRKTDLKCHMMDRLYHDAYGEEKARDKIASANSDYIILLHDVKLNDFYMPYLYTESETLSGKYISDNYTKQKEFINKLGKITILKKNE